MDYRQPDLSVITVNYNGFHDTCEFIDSWAATVFSVSYEMIVIDNGSCIRIDVVDIKYSQYIGQ